MAALLAGVAPVVAQSPDPIAAGDVVLLGGRLFDGAGDALVPNPGILVRNGTIVRVGVTDDEAGLAAARVVRVDSDATVLPGLIDLHAHYAVDLFGEERVDEYEVNPVVFLANGVTSTFPAGEVDPEGMERARREIAAGERPGPRLLGSGPYFGTARPGWIAERMTADSIGAEVDHWADRGVSGFKAKGIGPEQLAALIEAAHRRGLPVTAHLDSGFRGSVNPRDAILMGIDRIEHFMGGDAIRGDRSAYASLEHLDLADPATAAAVDRTIELYLDKGTFYDATLTAYGYFGDKEPAVYDKWAGEMDLLTPYVRGIVDERVAAREPNAQFERIYRVKPAVLKAFYDAGGGHLITLGTDHPSWGEFFSGFSAHRELHALVRAGIPPADALRIATVNGARAMGMDERLGTVEPGKYADLFVVRGDPLSDIRVTRDILLVMKAGETYDPGELLRSVEGTLGPETEAEAEWWKGSVRFAR